MGVGNNALLCWVSIIADISNVLFGCLFIPMIIFKYYESHRHDFHIRKSIRYITVGFFSMSTLVPLAWILFRAESCDFEPFDSLPKINKQVTATLLIAVLVIHKIVFNIYMLLRLHLTFKNTLHSITIYAVSIYSVLFLIQVLCQLIYDFNQVYAYHALFEWTIYIYMLIDIALGISLITLFYRKLFQITLLHREHGDTATSYDGAGSEWHDFGMQANSRQVLL
eukprot:UN13008